MRTLVKTIITLVVSLILLALAGMIAITTIVHPNDFKNTINQKFLRYTGRSLTINGDIHWSFFPWLGIQVNQVALANASGFNSTPMAQIERTDIKVAVMPLLKGKIEIGEITLHGVELHLAKNNKGISNWQDLGATRANKTNATTTTNNSQSTDKTSPLLAVALTNLTIDDGHITWNDAQNNQAYDISNLQLHSHALKIGQPFPIDLRFNVKNPATALSGDVHLNGTITATLNQQFNVQGQLQSQNFQIGKFKLSAITAQFQAQNKVITINPIHAQLYQGSYLGDLSCNLTGSTPHFTTDMQLTDIQSEPLFHDLVAVSRLQLAGNTNLQMHLTTEGNSSALLLNHLNGQGQINFKNGLLKGVNIPSVINTGKSLLTGQKPSNETVPNQTDFGNITANFTINNGVVNNNDLALRAPDLQANGKGSVNLNKQFLDYQLMAQTVHNGKPDGTVIPLIISGPFANLTIRPELNALLQSQIQQQLDKHNDKLKKHITIEISKHLNGVLGDQLKQQLNSLFK